MKPGTCQIERSGEEHTVGGWRRRGWKQESLIRGASWLLCALLSACGMCAGMDEQPAGAMKPLVPGPGLEPMQPLTSSRQSPLRGLNWLPTTEQEVQGVKFDHLLLMPKYISTFGYDDNILGRSSSHQEGDCLATYAPSMALRYTPQQDLVMNAEYGFTWHEYLKGVARDYFSHDASGAVLWKQAGLEGLSLQFNGAYQQTGDTGVLESDYLAFTRLQSYNVGPSLLCHFNRLEMVFAYQYAVTHYFARRDLNDDYDTHGATAGFAYRITEKGTAVFVTYAFKHTDRPNQTLANYETHELRTGIQGQFRKLDFKAGVGMNANCYLDNSRLNGNQPGAFVNATYTPNHIVAFRLAANRALTASPLTGAATSIGVIANAQLNVARKQQVTLTASWLEEKYATYDRTTLQAGALYKWAFARHVSFMAQADHAERQQSNSFNVTINSATRWPQLWILGSRS